MWASGLYDLGVSGPSYPSSLLRGGSRKARSREVDPIPFGLIPLSMLTGRSVVRGTGMSVKGAGLGLEYPA